MITEERKQEIREAALDYRHILDYDNDLPEKHIGELIDLILELTSPETPTGVAESQEECPVCGGITDNDEFRPCAGACAEERAQNVPELQIGKGLPGCGCCDKCRDKCLEAWHEENPAAGEDEKGDLSPDLDKFADLERNAGSFEVDAGDNGKRFFTKPDKK